MTTARTLFEGAAVFDDAGRGNADEHYMRFARQGVPGFPMPKASPMEEAPEDLAHLLTWYADLRNRAPQGFAGEPISLQEIEAYQRKLQRVGVCMEPMDEELLARIDDVWRTCRNKSKQQTPPVAT